MKIPVHSLHIFQKPKVGNQWLASWPVMRYKHKISAMGGFDTASCAIAMPRAAAEAFFGNYVGNRVAVYVDNPAAPIWEGFISRVTINLPGIVMTQGMDDMGNRINVSYRTVSATETPITGSAVNDTTSQALYGIKEKTLRLTQHTSTVGQTYPSAIQATVLALTAYPLNSAAPGNEAQTIVEVEMTGFFHTLEWETCYNIMPGGGVYFNYTPAPTFSFVILQLTHMTNSGVFFDNTDYTGLSNNTEIYDTATTLSDTMWRQLQMLAECGDTTGVRWIAGITPTDWTTGTRRLYYQQASTTTKYTVRVNDGARIRDSVGSLVPPWTVRPDGVLKILDALVGWQGDGADPRLSYLMDIQYEADSQRVTWASDDSIEMQGALQVRKVHTSSDQVYGQRATNPMM